MAFPLLLSQAREGDKFMKLFRLLIIVPALFLQIGCGSNNSSNPNGQYYMGANGTCMGPGGQAVAPSYCSSAYNGGSQVCQGNYFYCQGGIQTGQCTPGQCTASPDNCRMGNPFMYMAIAGPSGQMTPGQPVTCQ